MFHTLISSNLHVNVIGSFEMPVFFLLSGYSLALTYGRTKYESNTRSCCTSPIEGGEDKRVLFKTFNFYRNRFARTMPVYYISNFVLGLSAYFFAFGTRAFSNVNAMWMFVASVINSLFPVGMILPGMMMPMVAPGWAISTLWFFYIVFPFLLPRTLGQRVLKEHRRTLVDAVVPHSRTGCRIPVHKDSSILSS